jgi:hypothetical protein
VKAKWLDRRISAPGPYLTLALTQEQFHAALDHCGVAERPQFIASDSADATCHVLEKGAGGLACIVCLVGWAGRDPIEVAGLLVHEAVHVWQRYASRIGESNPGDEQEAYAIQAIAQELMAEFARQIGARK